MAVPAAVFCVASGVHAVQECHRLTLADALPAKVASGVELVATDGAFTGGRAGLARPPCRSYTVCCRWIRRCAVVLACGVSLAVAVCARAADGEAYGTPAHPANPRGINQTGVFPAHGLALTFREGLNVAWKTPLPNFGMSTPVVVGDRVFVTCDPGWTADCPLLVAVNRASGAIGWQAELDNLDGPQWDDAQRAEGKRLRAEEYRYLRRANELTWALRQASDDAARAALKEKASEEGLVLADTALAFSYPRDHARSRGYRTLAARGYLQHEGWSDGGRYYTGQAMPSVVSDGIRVYAQTNTNAVACFELGGARLWINDTRVPFGSGILTASPCLVGDTLIVFVPRSAGVTAIGYDKLTGAERWRRVLAPSCYQYSPGSTPVPLDIAGTPAVYLTSGHVLRVGDGKVLGKLEHPASASASGARPESHFGNYGNSVARGDRLFVTHGSYGCATPGVFAYRLGLDNDVLVSTLLWSIVGTRATVRSYQHLILDGDRVICADMNCIADAETGRVLAGLNGVSTMDPGPIKADGMLIVVDRYTPRTGPRGVGASPVSGCGIRMLDAITLKQVGTGHLDVDPAGGEKARQRVARSGRDTWGWGGDTWGGQQCLSSPVADGDCLFLRSNDYLYCIGR